MDLDSPQLKGGDGPAHPAPGRTRPQRHGRPGDERAGRRSRHYWTSPMETFDVTVPDSAVMLPFRRRARRRRCRRRRPDRLRRRRSGARLDRVGGSAATRPAPDAGAVIHTHGGRTSGRRPPPARSSGSTTTAVSSSTADQALLRRRWQRHRFQGGHRREPRARSVLIMRNHGAVVVGETIEMAPGAPFCWRRPPGSRCRPNRSGARHFPTATPWRRAGPPTSATSPACGTPTCAGSCEAIPSSSSRPAVR